MATERGSLCHIVMRRHLCSIGLSHDNDENMLKCSCGQHGQGGPAGFDV